MNRQRNSLSYQPIEFLSETQYEYFVSYTTWQAVGRLDPPLFDFNENSKFQYMYIILFIKTVDTTSICIHNFLRMQKSCKMLTSVRQSAEARSGFQSSIVQSQPRVTAACLRCESDKVYQTATSFLIFDYFLSTAKNIETCTFTAYVFFRFTQKNLIR